MQWRCPECAGKGEAVKAGRNKSGSQRLKCKACGKRFTPQPTVKGYPAPIRSEAVQLYLSGLSFRAVSTRLGVNHQSVINWVNAYASQLPLPKGRRLVRK